MRYLAFLSFVPASILVAQSPRFRTFLVHTRKRLVEHYAGPDRFADQINRAFKR